MNKHLLEGIQTILFEWRQIKFPLNANILIYRSVKSTSTQTVFYGKIKLILNVTYIYILSLCIRIICKIENIQTNFTSNQFSAKKSDFLTLQYTQQQHSQHFIPQYLAALHQPSLYTRSRVRTRIPCVGRNKHLNTQICLILYKTINIYLLKNIYRGWIEKSRLYIHTREFKQNVENWRRENQKLNWKIPVPFAAAQHTIANQPHRARHHIYRMRTSNKVFGSQWRSHSIEKRTDNNWSDIVLDMYINNIQYTDEYISELLIQKNENRRP